METEICSDGPRRRKVKLREASRDGALSGKELMGSVKAAAEAEPARGKEQEDLDQGNGLQQAAGVGKVMLTVLRVCANPRVVLCTYSEGGVERRVLVRVKQNVNFRRGMELEARRAAREGEPWIYEGRMPRFGGRW